MARRTPNLPIVHLIDERLKSCYRDTLLSNKTSFVPFQPPLFKKFVSCASELPTFDFFGDKFEERALNASKKEEIEALEKLTRVFHKDHVDYVIGSQVLSKVGQNWYYHGFLSFHHNHNL